MKKIECYIQPYELDKVAEQLWGVKGVKGLSASEVKGFGVERGFKSTETPKEGEVKLLPKLKVEMVVADDDVEGIIAKLREVLRTGRLGDGKMFVTPVDDAVRTRTGERGEDAIR
jgi:nitrogen regulatory protein P-II 1